MVLPKKVYGVKPTYSASVLMFMAFYVPAQKPKPKAAQSEICHFRRFQLQLKLVSDKRNKLTISRSTLSLFPDDGLLANSTNPANKQADFPDPSLPDEHRTDKI